MTSQKAALVDAIYAQMASNEKAKDQFKKEFKVDDKTFEKMVKKMLDIWIDSPDMVMFLSEALGVYPTDEEVEDEGEEGGADYLG